MKLLGDDHLTAPAVRLPLLWRAAVVVQLVLLVALLVVGWVVAARLEAVVDRLRLENVRDRMNLSESVCYDLRNRKPTDPELIGAQARRDYWKKQFDTIRSRHPEWFLPDELVDK